MQGRSPDEAIAVFRERAHDERAALATGSSMPAAEVENWHELLALIDQWLQPRALASLPDGALQNAQRGAEHELALDAQLYGDIPPELADELLACLARIRPAVRAPQLADPPNGLEWPVEPVAVTSAYGLRRHPVLGEVRPHQGIDLAASQGQLVSTAAKGRVVFAGWNGSFGKQVVVDHGEGVVTRYSHLSELLVAPGLLLERGAPVGLAGSTGLSTGVHVHFELLRHGRPVNPLAELALR